VIDTNIDQWGERKLLLGIVSDFVCDKEGSTMDRPKAANVLWFDGRISHRKPIKDLYCVLQLTSATDIKVYQERPAYSNTFEGLAAWICKPGVGVSGV